MATLIIRNQIDGKLYFSVMIMII